MRGSNVRLVRHIAECTHRGFGHTDAANRMSDTVNQIYANHGWDCVGRYIAFRLADGNADRTVYDTFRDAVRHNDQSRHKVIRLPGSMYMHICEAEIQLRLARQAADSGFQFTDPDARDGGRTQIAPITTKGVNRLVSTMGRK